MYLTSYGAVREVTGSMHLICGEEDRILLDCGMFQGRRKESDEKNRVMPIDPGILNSIILSHSHIDHSGRIPLLTKKGFNGRIYCTRATADTSEFLLMDSAHIQESDAEYLNYKTARSALRRLQGGSNKESEIKKRLKQEGHRLNVAAIDQLISQYNLQDIKPLYTAADAEAALGYFEGIPYRHPVSVGKNTTCIFYEAGHIMGSAFTLLRIRENGREYRIGYTGDLGRFNKPIIRDPCLNFLEEDKNIDLLLMESTYGNRFHEPVGDTKPALAKIINETVERGGTVIIPAFAFGRTQELLYVIHELYDENKVPRVPVFVDSPLATNLTRVFGEHPEIYDKETHKTFLENGENPFAFKELRFIGSVEESMALNRETSPHIVIAASGMCEAGRVLHHLRWKIHNPVHTVLIVGYMAQNTLGRRILELGSAYEKSGRTGLPPVVKLLNKEYPLKARVKKIGGFSAHGDRNDMFKFLKESGLNIGKIVVVHGEEDQSIAFADFLNEKGYHAIVPKIGEPISIK
ncbi:MAG: MBL fold metallo-hydrolase [Desulfobacteraceae bacterium]|nr:MBL fold metallo-hydrolase [Desulfobacteraceae bacterium]MBU4001754.1 MBL fold metallo-hydrolase [Pseudomonadota bacterium]MBU4055121.1 MBL fold metallo-hydrolase [Pseudomonadota bacterium]